MERKIILRLTVIKEILIVRCFLIFFLMSSCQTYKNAVRNTNKNNRRTIDSSALSSMSKNSYLNDTTALIQSIKLNKNKYLQKPLFALFKDLPFDIKSYSIINHRIDSIDGINIFFIDYNSRLKRSYLELSPQILRICFDKPIPAADYNNIRKKSKDEWGSLEITFFSKFIVKDIEK